MRVEAEVTLIDKLSPKYDELNHSWTVAVEVDVNADDMECDPTDAIVLGVDSETTMYGGDKFARSTIEFGYGQHNLRRDHCKAWLQRQIKLGDRDHWNDVIREASIDAAKARLEEMAELAGV